MYQGLQGPRKQLKQLKQLKHIYVKQQNKDCVSFYLNSIIYFK